MHSAELHFSPDELKRKLAGGRWSPMEAWEGITSAIKSLPQADRNEFVVWLYNLAENPNELSAVQVLERMGQHWDRTTDHELLSDLLDNEEAGLADVAEAARIIIASCLDGLGPATPDGLQIVYESGEWRIARLASPKAVIRYDPQLANVGCRDALEEALFFAVMRSNWVVERHGQPVGIFRHDDYPDNNMISWVQPEWVAILQDRPALFSLPDWIRERLWSRCIEYARRERGEVAGCKSLEQLADEILRAYMLSAVRAGDRATLDEIAKASGFWTHSREELLQENPHELRRWSKLLHCSKEERIQHNGCESTHAIHRYALALHHAAGFLLATESE